MTPDKFDSNLAALTSIILDEQSIAMPFAKFEANTRVNAYGIANGETLETELVMQNGSKLLRVRPDSIYLEALKNIEGWKVVRSNTLGRYGVAYGVLEMLNKIVVGDPQIKVINNLTEETDVQIDLGESPVHRSSVYRYICNNVSSENRNRLHLAINNIEPRVQTVRLSPARETVSLQEGRGARDVVAEFYGSSRFGDEEILF